jgi:hypothetical protein
MVTSICRNYTKKMVMSLNETAVANMALHNPDSSWSENYKKIKISIRKYGN